MNKNKKIIHIIQYLACLVAVLAGLTALLIDIIPRDTYPGYIGNIKMTINQLHQLSDILIFICVLLLIIVAFTYD